jgi:hypothetical protein
MLLYEKSGNPAHNWGAEEKKCFHPHLQADPLLRSHEWDERREKKSQTICEKT